VLLVVPSPKEIAELRAKAEYLEGVVSENGK
jgi:hypothetical protein